MLQHPVLRCLSSLDDDFAEWPTAIRPRQAAAQYSFHAPLAPPIRFLWLIQDWPKTADNRHKGEPQKTLWLLNSHFLWLLLEGSSCMKVQAVESQLVVIHPAQVCKLSHSQGRLSGCDQPPATKSPTLCGHKHLLSSAPLLLSVLLRWPWTRAAETLWKQN